MNMPSTFHFLPLLLFPFFQPSNYSSGNLCATVVGGWALSWTVSISKKTFRTIRSKLDQCVAPNLTMCLLYLSVYGCCKLTELNDF